MFTCLGVFLISAQTERQGRSAPGSEESPPSPPGSPSWLRSQARKNPTFKLASDGTTSLRSRERNLPEENVLQESSGLVLMLLQTGV